MIADIPTGSWIVLAGALVAWYSTMGYAVLTARGLLRPSLASWGVWTATAALGTASSWASGSTVGVLISGATCLRCGQVFLPAVKVAYDEHLLARAGLPPRIAAEPHGRVQVLLDRGCLAACALIGVIWAATDNAPLAFALSIAVDGIAALPTIWHGWQGGEHPRPYLLGLVGPVLALLCVRERVFVDYGWPLYEVAINVAMLVPPLVVGWPGRRHPSRALRMGGPLGGLALIAGMVILVFGVMPIPNRPAPVFTPALTALSVELPPIAAPRFPLALPGATPCTQPHSVAPSPGAARLAVICFDTDAVWLLNRDPGGSWTPVTSVEVGNRPQAAAWTPDGRRVLTADNGSGTVSVVDTVTGRLVAQLDGFPSPLSVTVAPDGRRALVTCFGAGGVRVVDLS